MSEQHYSEQQLSANGYIRRPECEAKHRSVDHQIDGLDRWVAKIDGRIWSILIGITVQMIATVATLIIILNQNPGGN